MSLRDAIAPLWAAARPRGLQRDPPGAFRILMFHGLAAHQRDDFAALIDRVAAGPGFIDPAEAARRLDGGAAPAGETRAPTLISFDDGFASNADIARDVLAPRGLRAFFFVCPGLIDLTGAAQEEAVLRQVFCGHRPPHGVEPMMTWDQIGVLAADGHGIGAHSMMHTRLAGLDAAELADEVGGARDALHSRLEAAPDWFAYPFGDIDSIDTAALAAIGGQFRFCRSGVRGLNAPGVHRLALRAENIDPETGRAWQFLSADGALDGRYREAQARLDHLAQAAAPQGAA